MDSIRRLSPNVGKLAGRYFNSQNIFQISGQFLLTMAMIRKSNLSSAKQAPRMENGYSRMAGATRHSL
jgi:hypothetical protein